ncbi:hypothetical protein QL285_089937 [Trifolium repens]|nr:hypothetical protein QL285_089937 [Trifolium repens]
MRSWNSLLRARRSLSTMLINSEEKSKSERKAEVSSKFPVPRRGRRRCQCHSHHLHIGAYDWLPIPKDEYPAYLADMAAAKKALAEGKPPDKNKWRQYFRGKEGWGGDVSKPKRLPCWKQKQLLKEWKEKDAARVKAKALKRKKKKAFRMKKKMEQELLQPLLEQERLLQK